MESALTLQSYNNKSTQCDSVLYFVHLYVYSVSDEDFDAVFPSRSTDGYIMVDSLPVLALSQLTVSMWMKTDTCAEKHTLMIYCTDDHEEEILLKLEKTLIGVPGVLVCKLSITMKDVEYVAFLC